MYAARITRRQGVTRRPLTVSRPGDEREKQADQVAEQAMRSDNPARAQEPTTGRPGAGDGLPENVRAVMEPRFGHDFGHVRVHQDAEAERLAFGVGARAGLRCPAGGACRSTRTRS